MIPLMISFSHEMSFVSDMNVCMAYGNVQFETSDGTIFHFRGHCKYNLVSKSDPTADIPDFKIFIKNEAPFGIYTSSRISYVELQIFGHVVRVARYTDTLPKYSGFYKSGEVVLVSISCR